MLVTVALHVHENEGSADSSASAGEMIRAYRRQFDTPVAIGFVGHDVQVFTDHPEVITFDGVEYEKRKTPTRLHIVEYPEYDFRILAHPSETWPDKTRERALEAIDEYDIDAVEKWNAGNIEYRGSLPVPEIAGDDAHSTVGTAASDMRATVDSYTPDGIMGAVMDGRAEVINDPAYRRDVFHQVEKSANTLWDRIL